MLLCTQEDTSSPLTELLDGGTILMDVCKIQGLNRYFAKFNDEFGWLVKNQGRIWGITQDEITWSLELFVWED